jgi:aryl-alcohol dehydrogenase-like predicted oxidoreductase
VLDELGIAVTAYGVLSRGLLSSSKLAGPTDFRTHSPRFSEANRPKNQSLVDALNQMAGAHGTTAVRLAIAWVLHKRANLIPTLGSRTRPQLQDALGAIDLMLSAEDIAKLEAAVPASQIAGDRYAPEAMRSLDSER